MTDNDQKVMKKVVFDGVLDALEQVVFPRFDSLESKVNKIEAEVGELKEEVGGLGRKVEGLENDMYYVKNKVELIENKMNENINMSFVAKDHERRIKKLERVTLA